MTGRRNEAGRAGGFGISLACFASILLLAALPTDLGTQELFAAILIVLVFVLGWLQPAGAVRVFMLTIMFFISARYMMWRVTETIVLDDPLGGAAALALFGAELYGFVLLALSVFINSDTEPRPAVGMPVAPDAAPSVDILVPTYNEAPELLEKTLTAALAVRYPAEHLRVYLLDDGGTEQRRADPDPARRASAEERHRTLRSLCDRLGATYLTRARNEHAKAGNINAALPRTAGELILVLDADHVPTRDILERTVGHFVANDRLFLVQTPHFFINPDPLERNLDTFTRMPSENEMFYRVIQPGLDRQEGSFFCGSAALLRRRHLMEIGGLSGETITEDAETALELHARGYESAYVPTPMIAGLSPETMTGFLVQRMRWSQGMTQILLLKNPLLRRGLTAGQRLCYLNSSIYWMFPLARIVFVLAPLVYLFFGLNVYDASIDEFFAYAVPHIAMSLSLGVIFYGRLRWLFVSEIYELLQCVHCSLAVLKVFRSPRSPSFVVTPKGEQLERSFISPVATPFYVVYFLLLAGEAVGIARLFLDPAGRDLTLVLLFWNSFHLLLASVVMGVLYERHQARGWPRLPRRLPVRFGPRDTAVDGVTVNLSATGLEMVVDPDAAERLPRDSGSLDASAFGSRLVGSITCRVRWTRREPDGVHVGLDFAPRSAAEERSAVLLFYGRSEAWEEFRDGRTHTGGQLVRVASLFSRGLLRAGEHLVALIVERGWTR